MTQLQLFRRERAEAAPRPPDLLQVRRSLNRALRLVRDAEIVPWSEGETVSRETQFRALAALLPSDEAEAMTSAFRSELTRLRAED